MATRVRQIARVRAGGRVKIRSNFPNKKITMTIPRGMRIKVNKI